MIKVIQEGENIPNGFYIKVGFFSKIEKFEEFAVHEIRGSDGLVEMRSIYPRFKSSEETKPWVTLGFRLGIFDVSYRIRSWTDNIFRFHWK